MSFFEFLFSIIYFFVASVIMVMVIGKYSAKDSTLMCCEFVKDFVVVLTKWTFSLVHKFFSGLLLIFEKWSSKRIEYPTIVGYENGYIVFNSVDKEFEALRANFDTCYCTYAAVSNDRNYVSYQFNIQRKPNSPEDEALELLLQKQAEETVAKTMRMYNCFKAAEPLTVVELFPSVLRVTFARTEEGIKIVDEIRQNVRRRRNVGNIRRYDSMTERWEQNHE